MSEQHLKMATSPLRSASTRAKASLATTSGTAGWAVLERLPAGAEYQPSETERWRAQQRALGASPLRVSARRPASSSRPGRNPPEERRHLIDADLEAPTQILPAPGEVCAPEVTTGLRGAIVSLPLTDSRAEDPTTAELPSAASAASNGTDPESTRCCPVVTEAAPPPLPRGPLLDGAVGRAPAPPLPCAAVPLPHAALPLPRGAVAPTDTDPLRQRAVTLVTALKAASPAQKALLLLLPVAFGALGALSASRLGAPSAAATPHVPAPLEGATPRAEPSADRRDRVSRTPIRPLPREPRDTEPPAPRAPSEAEEAEAGTAPEAASRAAPSRGAERDRSASVTAASSPRRAMDAPRGRPPEAPMTLARQAVDALVAGSRDEAERLYRALAASHPEDRALATAAEVLRANLVSD